MTVTVPNQPYFLYNKLIKAILNIHQIDNGLTHILSVFLFVFFTYFFPQFNSFDRCGNISNQTIRLR